MKTFLKLRGSKLNSPVYLRLDRIEAFEDGNVWCTSSSAGEPTRFHVKETAEEIAKIILDSQSKVECSAVNAILAKDGTFIRVGQ